MENVQALPAKEVSSVCPPRQAQPIFGTASLVLSALVGVVWYCAGLPIWKEMNPLLGIVAGLALYVGTFAMGCAGVISGTVALWRKERLRYLGIVGLILNILACAWISRIR